MESLNAVGNRLDIAREACQLNKFEVAKGIGVHASTIMRWETGQRRPKLSDIEMLASVYQVEVDWLLHGEPGAAPEMSPERKERAKAALLEMRRINTESAKLAKTISHPRQKADIVRRAIGEYQIPVTEETRLLDAISERVRPLLLAQHRLPDIPEVSPEVIRAVRNGLVVPTPWLIYKLAACLNVYPGWLLEGEPSEDQSTDGE